MNPNPPLAASPSASPFSARRLLALVRKEGLQVVRDPSAILIAFVLPVILLFLFAYAVSLDIRQVPIGLVLTAEDPRAQSLAAAFAGTRYFRVTPARDSREVSGSVEAGDLDGLVVIPADFARRLADPRLGPLVEIITDGSQPNTANFVANYAQGVVTGWAQGQGLVPAPLVDLRPRFWFNPEIESRRFLVPGAIGIIMTMIGTLLTALVLAREWERGTMEALLVTPVRVPEILLGKILPYFLLGMGGLLFSIGMAVWLFTVPLRGSLWVLLATSALFLLTALGMGLLISTIARNQFVAGQVAIIVTFLPAFILSGFIFDINSMPTPVQLLTHIVPARYYVSILQTVFLAGNIWPVILLNALALLLMAGFFLMLVRRRTRKRLP